MKRVPNVARILQGVRVPVYGIYPGIGGAVGVNTATIAHNHIQATPHSKGQDQVTPEFTWVGLFFDARAWPASERATGEHKKIPIGFEVFEGRLIAFDDLYLVFEAQKFRTEQIPEGLPMVVMLHKEPYLNHLPVDVRDPAPVQHDG